MVTLVETIPNFGLNSHIETHFGQTWCTRISGPGIVSETPKNNSCLVNFFIFELEKVSEM
jgi:hypothetical protein